MNSDAKTRQERSQMDRDKRETSVGVPESRGRTDRNRDLGQSKAGSGRPASESNRRDFLKILGLGAAAAGISTSAACSGPATAEKPNVLFIAVDDLRPQLGCYGHKQMISPHMDTLAETGTVFLRSYCNVPVCGASRASLLTGLRPKRDRFTQAHTKAQADVPNARAIQSHFKEAGYHTVSNGKLFQHTTDWEEGWTEPPWRPNGDWWGWQAYVAEESKQIIRDKQKWAGRPGGPAYHLVQEPAKYHPMPGWGLVPSGPPTEAPDVADNRYPDGMLADKVIADLERLGSDKDKPFFIAAGFVKPHLPFAAPKKYWDLYDVSEIDLADNPFRPKGAPDEALHNWKELRTYAGIPAKGPLDEKTARELIHGYYACVSYTDAQVGRLLDALERFGLAENTIVVLWGDHGWNLGEHGLWCKHCNFETSLHSPLIVRDPRKPGGTRVKALTEFVDIYPSLCELCGLDVPESLDGMSFAPLMDRPDQPWKEAVFSRYENGDSVKTDRYRYTEYTDDNGKLISRMLFDHQTDPAENINLANSPDHREILLKMQKQLHSINRI